MAITFNYDATELKVVQNTQTGAWFVFDLNEGDVVSRPFANSHDAHCEMLSLLAPL